MHKTCVASPFLVSLSGGEFLIIYERDLFPSTTTACERHFCFRIPMRRCRFKLTIMARRSGLLDALG